MQNEDKMEALGMHDQGFKAHLIPVVNDVENTDLGQWQCFSYPADPNDSSLFVHEYAFGRRVLVRIDQLTGREHFVREL
jgi:hypothetical protein